MSDATVQFNDERTYLGLVKLEADSAEDAERRLNGALSYAQATGNLGVTFEVLCAVADDAEGIGELDEAIAEELDDDDANL